MPQVEFHSGVAAPLQYACRLLRKAWRQQVAVLVTAPPPLLAALDRELWTFEALEFVPHRRLQHPQQRLPRACHASNRSRCPSMNCSKWLPHRACSG